ncbi:Serine/threonine-protein kinase PknH [Gemmata obscuriglobus]|uniref:serine/threonine protein kinase n=1 Tax=Gemmata obscuriglobus TaxID=114 RepID=UPI00016C458E|nr:serine/threonine-protein kinase [Gemmata obscuriglobus]QEG31103.1 Serine/threonine-protein kinase PknH [Gemmata obscuriglobus]VTS10440.1 serine threonine protein kinase : Serine/threonine protein kinase OS=Planctomyces brasiliensis (strain ATCC 49424 / DSM 5305 / JCM 21570 / NBRC 103401 / IFAM 1448) GN=Plabr_2195 PE=3 SV=1: Pkinase [Gemmata obscuriglobus UQM 2246]
MVTSDLGACEWFVWDLRRSGLIDRGPLDQIVGEFLKRNPRAEAPALAEFLVDQGTLTAFQAERILNGKSQGLVLGPYVLLDAIGSGSMGQVYKASSKNDSNLYAVKVLPRRSMWNVRLARRQVRSFATFEHPAVVPFVDVGTAGGLHYLAWPLVEGTTLESLIQHHGKLAPATAALYAVQVAQGLTVAHQNNLFHGLVKPSNVMIGSDNQARILDFGIGSLLVENEGESLVDTMSTANTLTSGLDCASPESIMEPTNRTPAGDQYSLGCVLYYALTGHVPFPEGSAVEKMMAHQTKEPTPIRELVPNVPAGLAAVVQRLMAKPPEERYSGCDELVEALEPFLDDLNQLNGPGGSGARTPPGSQSGGRMPGLGGRSNPGTKITLPSRSGPGSSGTRSNPASSSMIVPPSAQTPQPPASRGGVPSRASFNLPAVSDETEGGAAARSHTPPELGRPMPKLPTRGATTGRPEPTRPARPAKPMPPPELEELPDAEPAWAEETVERRTKGNAGTIGLIAVAVVLMVIVYIGATLLMK